MWKSAELRACHKPTPCFGIHWMIGAIFVKFIRLTFTITIKIVATRSQILRVKCTKLYFGWGSTPDPAGWAYSAPPDPLAGFKGPTSKGRGRERREWRGLYFSLRIYPMLYTVAQTAILSKGTRCRRRQERRWGRAVPLPMGLGSVYSWIDYILEHFYAFLNGPESVTVN